MTFAKSFPAIFLSLAMAVPVFAQANSVQVDDGHGFLYRLTRNYQVRDVAPVSFVDSPRIDKLLRAGNIYLSLRDAIALALENNLDIESARYDPSWHWPICSAPAPASCCATFPPAFRRARLRPR